ncbi:MAG: hypothetical protein VX954_04325 [Candidatus Thermoplasmatota archaeon]|nr:hypothetical protein [Candidatus Thermoplasmatota archaeon]
MAFIILRRSGIAIPKTGSPNPSIMDGPSAWSLVEGLDDSFDEQGSKIDRSSPPQPRFISSILMRR